MSDRFNGFTINLLQDGEGNWLVHFIELSNVSAFGDTPEEALHELDIAWQTMKESYAKHNDPIPVAPSRKAYSGQFNVRIDKRIHRLLAISTADYLSETPALLASDFTATICS